MVDAFSGSAAQKLAMDMMSLELQCRRILGKEPSSNYITQVPHEHQIVNQDSGESTPIRRLHRLYQIGFSLLHHPKSPAASYCVEQILESLVFGQGAQTHRYPLEIEYSWEVPGQQTAKAGDEIQNFSLVVLIGSSVCMSHMAFVLGVLRLNILNDSSLETELQQCIALNVMKAMVVTCTCRPAGSKAEQLTSAMGEKMQAALRTRPTPTSMAKVFKLVMQTSLKDGEDEEDMPPCISKNSFL